MAQYVKYHEIWNICIKLPNSVIQFVNSKTWINTDIWANIYEKAYYKYKKKSMALTNRKAFAANLKCNL